MFLAFFTAGQSEPDEFVKTVVKKNKKKLAIYSRIR